LSCATHQSGPGGSGDTTIQSGLCDDVSARLCNRASCRPQQIFDAKTFEDDQVVVRDELRGSFFDPIFTTVSSSAVEECGGMLGSRTPAGTLLLPGQFALQAQQALFLCLTQPRDIEALPIARRHGVR
jgi:hypothetical protein